MTVSPRHLRSPDVSPVVATWNGGVLLLHVEGPLQEELAPALTAALPSGRHLDAIVVDLEQAHSLDQAGTAAVLTVVLRGQERGAATAIAAFDPEVLQVLLVNGISFVAPITANATDALRLVRTDGRPRGRALSAASAVGG